LWNNQGCVLFVLDLSFSITIFLSFSITLIQKTHRDSKSFELFWLFYFDGCTCMNKTCIDQTCIVWTQRFCPEMLFFISACNFCCCVIVMSFHTFTFYYHFVLVVYIVFFSGSSKNTYLC
jgi:hypothetical protein